MRALIQEWLRKNTRVTDDELLQFDAFMRHAAVIMDTPVQVRPGPPVRHVYVELDVKLKFGDLLLILAKSEAMALKRHLTPDNANTTFEKNGDRWIFTRDKDAPAHVSVALLRSVDHIRSQSTITFLIEAERLLYALDGGYEWY